MTRSPVYKNYKGLLKILCIIILPLMVLAFCAGWREFRASAQAIPVTSISSFELVERRTPNSKTFENFNGTQTTIVYSRPIHYQDANGNYREIDTTIRDFQVTTAPFKATFGRTPRFKFEVDTTAVEFIPQNVNPVQGKLDKNQITYHEAFPSTDIRYTVQSKGVKEQIVLKNSQAPSSFTFEILSSTQVPTGVNCLLDFGLFNVTPPSVLDAQGRRGNVSMLTFHSGDKTFLTLTVDPDWIQQVEYPVTIDPSTSISAPYVEDSYVDVGKAGPQGGTDYLNVKTGSDGVPQRITLVRFDLEAANIPRGSLVNEARVYLYKGIGGGVNPNNIDVHQVVSEWYEDMVVWKYQPRYGEVVSTTNVYGATAGYRNWDVTTLVQDWVWQLAPNYGVSFEGQVNSDAWFWSSEHGSGPYLSITYNQESTPPTVSISRPTTGSFIGGATYTITGRASDNEGGSGLSKVEISTDGGSTWDPNPANGRESWNYKWTLPSDGNYTIKARATDRAGNFTISSPVSVTVDNKKPTATISSPTEGQVISQPTVPIIGTATDANFKQYKVEYGLGGLADPPTTWSQIGPVGTNEVNNSQLAEWHITPPYNEIYTIRLTVTDKAGNVQVAKRTVTVGELPEVSPHPPYTEDTPACAGCHTTHTAVAPMLLNTSTTYQAEFCYSCHDGTGSGYNIKTAFDENPVYHPIRDEQYPTGTLDCTSCHDVHGVKKPEGGYYAKLLSADGVYEGDEFCGVCHGAGSTLVGGDHLTSYAGIAAHSLWCEPPSGTGVSCSTCHFSHGSEYSRLARGVEENLCYECHNDPLNSLRGWNVKSQFSLASSHDITASTVGGRVECTSCHGPHVVKDVVGEMVADPDNTKQLWGDQVGENITNFCLKCHDSDSPKAKTTLTEIVPYTISFPTMLKATNQRWYQTDWSGGPGQTNWDEPNKYSSGSNVDSFSEEGTVKLAKIITGNNYAAGRTYVKSVDPSPLYPDTGDTEFTDGVLSTSFDNSFGYYKQPTYVQIDIDLGSTKTVSKAVLSSGAGGPLSILWGLGSRSIQVSTNGTTWTTVDSRFGSPEEPHEIWTFSPTSARYVRFRCNPFSTYDWMFLGEGAVGGSDLSVSYYVAGSGTLTSSTYDTHAPGTPGSPSYGKIYWDATTETGITNVKFQIATSNNPTGPWYFVGPTGPGSYYTTSGSSINSLHNSQRYIRYKAFLSSTDPDKTPILKNVTITYTNFYEPSVYSPFFPGWDKTQYTSSGHASKGYQCNKCHHPHGSENPRLTAYYDDASETYDNTSNKLEEKLCLTCHKSGGPSGAADINSQLAKTYKHPIDDPGASGIHQDTEEYSNLAYQAAGSRRHAECADCHNPHLATSAGASAPDAKGSLAGVAGIRADGTPTISIKYQYELCFKCHSSYTTQKPGQTDMSKAFALYNLSYHPVEGTGKNLGIRSGTFVGGMSETSIIYCTDCHGSSDASAPSGPHGSNNQYILKKAGAQLCFLCHSQTTYTTNNLFLPESQKSRYQSHGTHYPAVPCTVCHDQIHGSFGGIHLSSYIIDHTEGAPSAILLFPPNFSCGGTPGCHAATEDRLGYDQEYPHTPPYP